MTSFTIGIDFGTASGRAILVDTADGRVVATATCDYPHGVIDERLPVDGSTARLPPSWALQDPADYLEVLRVAVPELLARSGVDPASVIGIGIDVTACTMLPTLADGTPLCAVDRWRSEPHAWVKLWKHHAAQPEADRINATARATRQPWLDRYGGRISSEWFFSKILQILDEAPEVYAAADRFIEATDWIVWRLTGTETRNACTAGYKAMWSKRDGYPDRDFFAALDPRLADVVETKLSADIRPVGGRAGGLSAEAAAWTGLRPGTAVAIGNVDAHVAVPAVTVTTPGRMVMIMGTSTCHMVLGPDERPVAGMCGSVEDGILPGLVGYEAGQSSVGDAFGWFVEHAVPPAYHEAARDRGLDIHAYLQERGFAAPPGASGLLALDWWNGNRSVLVDAELSGLLLGVTVATTPEEIYRALVEATAFGTRVIVEAFQAAGVAVDEVVACGGLADKSPAIVQLYADIVGLPFRVSASDQAPALGSAMFGAVAAGAAAGGHATIEDAAAAMARLRDAVVVPDPTRRPTYDVLYREYVRLHDYFGRGGNDVMRILRGLREAAIETRTPIGAQA